MEIGGGGGIDARRGCMYVLSQSVILTNKQLKARLLQYGYYESATKGLYKYTTKPTIFTLVVNDFVICMTSCTYLDHLHQALHAKYTTTIERSRSLYLGMTLKWNYGEGHADVSITSYIARALTRFHVQLPSRPQHSPHTYSTIQYGITTQLIETFNTPYPLDTAGIHAVKELVGVILYTTREPSTTLFLLYSTQLGHSKPL